MANLLRISLSETLGTALLLATVVGSGVMGERLSGGNVGLVLLANSIATGAALFSLILTLHSFSGAHCNPAVSLVAAIQGQISWRAIPFYVVGQILGALAGVLVAHLMFSLPMFSAGEHARFGAPQLFSEFVATFGLILVIQGCSRYGTHAVAMAVAAYITAAYWFTSSTSFANPAVTLARSATNTFVAIRPIDVPGFIVFQFLGAGAATFVYRLLVPGLNNEAGAHD